MSVSKWMADRVSKSVETSWPPGFPALAGAFPDFSDAGDLSKGYGDYVLRRA